MLKNKKTYLTAIAMVVYATAGYILGKDVDVDYKLLLEAAGLAFLRAGIAKAQQPD